VTNKNVPDEIVYSYVKQAFEKIDVIQKNHPACRYLKRDEMIEALSISIHSGAKKYFKENDLLSP
jgi:TRAP-type uncharacterized transport system substrate-binding protein